MKIDGNSSNSAVSGGNRATKKKKAGGGKKQNKLSQKKKAAQSQNLSDKKKIQAGNGVKKPTDPKDKFDRQGDEGSHDGHSIPDFASAFGAPHTEAA